MSRMIPHFSNDRQFGALLASAATLLFVVLVAPPATVQAQDSGDWEVEGGDERRQQVVRRYKKLLEKKPRKGVIFDKLVEYVGRGEGLDRLIAEYEKRVEKSPDAVNLRLILGHLLAAKDAYEEALTHYDRAVELESENPVARMSRGSAHGELQNREEAAADYETALEHVDQRAQKQELLRKLADLAFEQHEWDRAEKYYDQLIELDARNEYLRMEYAQVLIKHRRYEKAEEQYEKLLELSGRNPKDRATTLRDLGELYEKMGKDKKSVETYRKAQGLVQSNHWLYGALRERIIDVYRENDRLGDLVEEYERKWSSPNYEQSLLLGELSDEIGREEKALEYLKRASRLRSGATEPREKITEIHRRRGEDEKVVEQYRKLIRIAPNEQRFQFEMVRLYMQRGERDEAVEMLEAIRRRFQGRPEVYMTLADTYMRYDMEEKALETYKRLVEMDPDNESYIMSLGESYYRSGNMEKAVQTWKRLLESSLEEAKARARLGQVFAEHGMIERGVRNYRKAVELDPDDMTIRRGLASTYEEARRWDKAIEVWRHIMDHAESTETKAEARGRIIGIYERQHRLRSKLAEFEKKFDSDPPDREAGHFLAEGYLKLNNYGEAEKTYRKLIESDGEETESDIEAFEALERIYRQTGELEQAVEVLQKLAELRPERQREYYHQIAKLSLKLYEDDQAVRYAALAVEKNPEDAAAHARLGEVYRKMHRLEAAAEEYRRAVQLDSKAYRYMMELAEIVLELGEKREAEELYREVARKAEDDSLVLRAARNAIDLAEQGGRLRELESEFGQLVFRGADNSVYRKVMLELYERLVTPLMLAMRYGVGGERTEIQEQLNSVGGRASPVLMSALGGSDVGQRALAVRLLGGVREKSAALRLARMAVDPEESLRSLAAVSVAEIGAARAAGPLIQALDSSDPKVRELATWTLGFLRGKNVREALIDQLESGQNWTQKALAALGLGRIGDPEAETALRRALATIPPGESNDGVIVAIASALGEVGGGESVEALVGAMRRSPGDVQYVAANSLAQIERESAVRALIELRWGERTRLRAPAMRGLAHVVERLEREDASGESVALRTRFETLMADATHVDEREHEIDVPGLIEERKAEARMASGTESDLFFETYGDLIVEIAAQRLAAGSEGERGLAEVVLDDLWQSGQLRFGMLVPRTEAGASDYREAMAGLTEELEPLVHSERPRIVAPALGILSTVGATGRSGAALERLSSSSPSVRAAAVRAIGQAGSPEAFSRGLTEAMGDSSFTVRRAACSAIGDAIAGGNLESSQIEEATNLLVEALDDEYRSVRLAAVRAIGALGGETAAEELGSRIESFDTELKIEALSALAGNETRRARRLLERFENHPDFRIRRAIREPTASE